LQLTLEAQRFVNLFFLKNQFSWGKTNKRLRDLAYIKNTRLNKKGDEYV